MNVDLKEMLGRRIIEATHMAVAQHLNAVTELRRTIVIGGADPAIGGAGRSLAADGQRGSLNGGGFLRDGAG